METTFVTVLLVLCFQILALRLLAAVLPSWDKTERTHDMKFLVEKLFNFLGILLSTCSSDLPLLRGKALKIPFNPNLLLFILDFYIAASSPQRVPCEGGSPAPRRL